MIAVSNRWLSAQREQILPLSEIEIEYSLTEPGVQEYASAVGTPEESFSVAANVTKELVVDEPKYALLEHNQWVLDGTYRALPAVEPVAPGFVSRNLSNADGTFTEIPTITITFSEMHYGTIPGITTVWSKTYREWAEAFRITVYANNEVVSRFEVTDNQEVVSRVWTQIQGYNKVVLEILKWCLPYRRARLSECLFGIKQIYTKNDLMGFEHEQRVNLLSAELPKNSIVFKLDNSMNIWNPDNPTGVEKYLIEKQMVRVKYGFMLDGSVEWIKAGTFYMSEWQTPANGLEASFTARDLLEFCGGKYTGPKSGSVLTIVVAALEIAGIDSSSYVLDEAILDTVTTEFSEEFTCAEVLQLCANAARCCLWQCRDGLLHIEPVTVNLEDYIIGQLDGAVNNSYQHPEFTLTKELQSVDVNDGLGTAVTGANGYVQTIDNPLIVSSSVANAVAAWCRDCLKNRKIVSGEFRADPRLDALDTVTVVSKYGSSSVQITDIKYTYNGSFRGAFTGRVVDA